MKEFMLFCAMLQSFEIIIIILSYLIKDRVESQVVPEYLGCYKDSRDDISLKENQITTTNITTSQCNTYCFTKAYLHAATRDGKECRCGDLDVVPEPDQESFCNSKCLNEKEKCGGKDAYTLYTTGLKENEIGDVEELEIGCLQERDERRLLEEHKVDLIKTNSPVRCIAYCKALGFPHAGLQYASECFCGLVRRTTPLVEGCNKPCTGNRRQRCGGQWKAMIYSTGIAKAPPGVTARGCYEKNRLKIDVTKLFDKNEPNKCISYCYSNGFSFAHIFQGSTCLCGKTAPPSRYRGTAGHCNIQCPNKQKEMCGGEKHARTYSTGISSTPSLGKLVGCYQDENADLLNGLKINLGIENSIPNCISTCLEMGYAFAGLRNKFDCECSQTSPKRIPPKIVPDNLCSEPCPKNPLENCGAPLYTAIYRTGLTPPLEQECYPTVSKYNDKNACSGQILFRDDFNSLDTNKWQHTVRISGEDGEFVTYTSKKKNVYTENGSLVIKPTSVRNNFVKYGHLQLKGCTGEKNSTDCTRFGKYFHILPPLESGEICTKNSFRFIYGNITIRAKMPKGDWVVPQIWLKPSNESYGPGYMSGKLLLITSRGNSELMDSELNDIGARTVESGFQVATEQYGELTSMIKSITSTEPLYNDFVNYYITWAPDKVQFYVNGKIVSGLKTIFQYSGSSLLDEMDVDKEKHWSTGTMLAPFDQEFYLCIGLSVGGIHNFPDGSISNGTVKPWKNNEVKGQLKFWLNRNDWEATWSNETKLEVDYIQVTAL